MKMKWLKKGTAVAVMTAAMTIRAFGDTPESGDAAKAEPVRIVFAGDILFDDRYAVMNSMISRKTGIDGTISPGLLEEMRGADIFAVNNEFPYSDRGKPRAGKTYTFRARPRYASMLSDMGADLAILANNHMFDYGEEALVDTLDILDGIGIARAGAGRNLSEAAAPAYFDVGGMRIAFLAATQVEHSDTPLTRAATDTLPGVFHCRKPELLLEEIRKAKENSDFVTVYIHWGTESTDKLDADQKNLAPLMAEAGADLIIGDHPHVLQPIGYCGNVPVVYSLGNFLFNSKRRDTCLLEAVVDQDGISSLRFIPAIQANCRVAEADGKEGERILNYMRSISPEAAIDENGYFTKAGSCGE